MKRAMTLLEVLLALVLLATLVVATTSWTTLAATVAAHIDQTLARDASAEALLRLIHDELVVGDFTENKSEKDQPRILIDETDGSLVLHSRALSRITENRFGFDLVHQTVSMSEHIPGIRSRQRVLVSDVANASWILDDDTQSLDVTLTMSSGQVFSRRYALP